MEGTSLGLAALAEVLQKMDGRMEEDDAYAIQKAEQEEAAPTAQATSTKEQDAEIELVEEDKE